MSEVSASQRPHTDTGRTPGDPNPEAGAGATSEMTGAILNAAQLRWVKISIIVMTAMFAIGIPLLIGRIIYLAQRGNTPAAAAPTAAAVPAKLVDKASVVLPGGATVRSVSLAGANMAVHFITATGEEAVYVVDLQTGQVINRTTIAKAPDRF